MARALQAFHSQQPHVCQCFSEVCKNFSDQAKAILLDYMTSSNNTILHLLVGDLFPIRFFLSSFSSPEKQMEIIMMGV